MRRPLVAWRDHGTSNLIPNSAPSDPALFAYCH